MTHDCWRCRLFDAGCALVAVAAVVGLVWGWV